MAKTIFTKRRRNEAPRHASSKRAGLVRKNVMMDQRKLDVVRRPLGVDTETEAIDQALDFIAFREELSKGFSAMRRSGGIDDVLGTSAEGLKYALDTNIFIDGFPPAIRAAPACGGPVGRGRRPERSLPRSSIDPIDGLFLCAVERRLTWRCLSATFPRHSRSFF